MSRIVRSYFKPLIFLVFLVGLSLRLYHIDLPLLEVTPNRQLLTAEITRNLYRNHFIFLSPSASFDPLKLGLTFLEFPTYNLIIGSLYAFHGSIDETLGRMVSVSASTLGAIILTLYLRHKFSDLAIISILSVYFVLSPVSLQQARAYQPDQLMLTFTLAAVFFLDKWLRANKLFSFLLSAIFFALAALTKPSIGFMFIPMSYLFYKQFHIKTLLKKSFWLYWFIALTPSVLWYTYILPLNTSTPLPFISRELLASPTFYAALFYGIVSQLTTVTGAVFLPLGILKKLSANSSRFFLYWLFFGISFLFLYGPTTRSHWYYYLHILPPTAVFIGLSMELMIKKFSKKSFSLPWIGATSVIIIAIITAQKDSFISLYRVHPKHRFVLETVNKSQQLIPKKARILASSHQSAALFYYLDRPGSAFTVQIGHQTDVEATLKKFRQFVYEGYEYFVISDPNEFIYNLPLKYELEKHQRLSSDSDPFLIYKLRPESQD